jgi:type IV secretion system protein TrbB
MSNFATVHKNETHQRLDVKLRRELGEVVVELLADENVEDVLLNPDSSLWVKRIGGDFNPVGFMAPETAMSALSTVAAWRGTVLNHDNPILETELPIDGSRFEGIVSPVVRNPVFAIRLRPKKIFSLADYERERILTTKDDSLNKVRHH